MRTTDKTRLVGVLAHPAAGNLFHSMFSEMAATDDAAFILIDAQPKEIDRPVRALQTLGAAGVYLTGRLRTAADGLVDFLSDEAHGAGVINTITFDGDQATGHNTEARALIALLEEHRDQFLHAGAVVLGGGAMARSVVYTLVRHFRVRHVAIANRTLQQAQLLKHAFESTRGDSKIEAQELFPPDIAQLLAEARLIVNATPIGSSATTEATPITTTDVFHNRQLVVDVTYAPATTQLIRDASAAGARVITGEEILNRQVGLAFELLGGRGKVEG